MAVHIHSTLDLTELHDIFQYIASSDPGAVGAKKNWLDTTDADAPIWWRRNDANDDWILMLTGGPASSAGAVSGVFGSRPAFGTAGRIYYSTDSPGLVSIDTGAAWTDFYNGVPVTRYDPSGFSWVSQGDATESARGGFYELVGSTQNGDNLACRLMTLTDLSFTAIVGLVVHGAAQTTAQIVGLALKNSGSDRTAFWGVSPTGGYLGLFAQYSDLTTSPSTTSGTVGLLNAQLPPSGIVFLKLVGDGTDVFFYYSTDGGQSYTLSNQIAYASLGGGGLTSPNRLGVSIHTLGTTGTTPDPPPRAWIAHWAYTP